MSRHLFIILLLVATGICAEERGFLPEEEINPKRLVIRTPDIAVTACFGVGGIDSAHLPLPVVITIINNTSRNLELVWEVETFDDPDAHIDESRVISGKVFMSGKATKRIHRTMDISTGSAAVRIKSAGKVLWQDRDPFTNAGLLPLGGYNAKAIRILSLTPGTKTFSAPPKTVKPGNATTPLGVGKEIQAGSSPAWAMPTSSLPLFNFHAVVITDKAAVDELLPAQLNALCEYLRWGGCLIVQNAEFLKQLSARLPKSATERIATTVSEIKSGLSATTVCSGLLVTGGDNILAAGNVNVAQRKQVLGIIDARPNPTVPKYVYPASHQERLPPGPTMSLIQVSILFLLYALLTGPALIVIFRRRRSRSALWFAGITTAAFSILAFIMGPGLGMRGGDLEHCSVTELTPDGGEQWSVLTLSSAGARNHALQLTGTDISAWLVPNRMTREIYSYRYHRWGQRPLAKYFSMEDPGDHMPGGKFDYIPISPWGSRTVMSCNRIEKLRSIDVKVSLVGRFLTVTVKNTSPFPMQNAKMFIGCYTWCSASASAWQRRSSPQGFFYQLIPVGHKIMPGLTISRKVPANLTLPLHTVISRFGTGHSDKTTAGKAEFSPLLPTSPEEIYCTVSWTLDANPGLQITTDHFNLLPGRHVMVQRVNPKHLPPLAQLKALNSPLPKQNQ